MGKNGKTLLNGAACSPMNTCVTTSLAAIAIFLGLFVIFQLYLYVQKDWKDSSITKAEYSQTQYGVFTAADHIQSDAVQAVFLSNGQVYFGAITNMDAETITLEEVYYLQTDDGENSDDISLVKLGTGELHAPQDLMVISRSHVMFWENLTPASDVVKAMEEYDDTVAVDASGETEVKE
ncbi:MAG: hypothetical protein ABIG66_05560 [Candidatus Kerfeldbacteria bacterium]